MFAAVALLCALPLLGADRVKTSNGILDGAVLPSGIRIFHGVPFAAPPVGELRWKEPQLTPNWKGVRPATAFGPRCMQQALFSDMVFRSNGMGEDCLYLNVWTPAKVGKPSKLPVLVYFFGGGFMAGDGSESRYDGESMAKKGIVAVTVNYRLGVFGFLAHPELTKESEHHASGNYGLLDQSAALLWVSRNIGAFGGDASNVTVAGESAGSLSVSAVMASPLSKDLIAAAIGESGSVLGTLPAVKLAEAEKVGTKLGASIAALRAMSAQQVLDNAGKVRFPIAVDGYFFPEAPEAIYAAGKQSRVPLLAGWNSEEMTWRALTAGKPVTQESYEKAVRGLYGAKADDVLKVYSGDLTDAATDLASDRFIGFSTWKWIDMQAKSGQPVYRYYYARPRPGDGGAVHSAEIEYAMGNLDGNKVFAWTADDRKVSQVMQDYFANFVKTHNPNGEGLPQWPALNAGGGPMVMRMDVESKAVPEAHRERYVLLDKVGGTWEE
ncbi:MAG: carboxylesterase family protein [Bryobacteraceae bacterium]